MHSGWLFAVIWPYIRWVAIAGFTVLTVETIYFLAPNARQRFVSQIPGAVLAVLSWIAASWGWDGISITSGQYNQTLGAMGAMVALMLWFYVTALAIILGAEINSELLQAAGQHLLQKDLSEPFPVSPRVEGHHDLRKSA